MPPDKLRARLDFYHQAVTLTTYDDEMATKRVVSALDVAHALARDLAFGTGLLPPNALAWRNTAAGPVTMLYVDPKVWRIALSQGIGEPRRLKIPMPGLVFLCTPSKAPWVYAVKKRPTKEADEVFHAPLCNVFQNGLTCAGNNQYPVRIADTVQSFFISFFTAAAGLTGRSKRFPKSILSMWEILDKEHAQEYPLDDLVHLGTIKDLLLIDIGGQR